MNMIPKSVAQIAYQLWESRGCPDGSAERDWLEAERLLQFANTVDYAGDALDESAPAASVAAGKARRSRVRAKRTRKT
jgi:hypothetical protein